MRPNRLPVVAVALLAVALPLGGCAAASPSPSCEEVVAQASYEMMRQLAAAGLAADPAALRVAMPDDDDDADTTPEVELPSYETYRLNYSDAEQATLFTALISSRTGVGDVYDIATLYSDMADYGVCAGQLPH